MIACLSRIGGVAPMFAVAAVLALTGCGGGGPELSGVEFRMPPKSVVYEVRLDGMPTEEMTALAEGAMTVFRYQDQGATSLALLRRRAETDIETIQQVLRSNGYYQGSASVEVEPLSEEEFAEVDSSGIEWPSFSDLAFWEGGANPEAEAEKAEKKYALVTITVEPGKALTLARHDLEFIDPESGAHLPSAQALGSPVGRQARAVGIVGAEAAAVKSLKLNGYPYAARIDRDALADLELGTLEVETQFFSGPAVTYGPVDFSGLKDVDEAYLRTYIPWEAGAPVSADEIAKFNRDLLATGLFDTAVVTLPKEAPEVTGPVSLPVHVKTDERLFRSISAGAEYSTDEGPGVTFGFEHRNLWGSNETLDLRVGVSLEEQALRAGYREPQFGEPGRDLVGSLTLLREEHDAYDEMRATLTGGIEREYSEKWTYGYGGLVEVSRLTEDGETVEAYLGGIPTFAAYDGTDSLLNPTEGVRARLDLKPFAGTLASEFTSFLEVDARASTYWDILDNDAYVLAARGRLGSVVSAAFDDVPQNHRLYSGGGGSVRGYGKDEIGPLDEDGEPLGGRSVAELGIEMRAKVYGDLGVVVFADAGTVDRDLFPDFGVIQYAAGLGVRYYSPIGPIRLDVAVPINPRDRDDAFQLYFSIGQAF